MAVADRGLLLVGLEAGGSIYERLPGLRRSSSVLLEQVLVFLSASCSQTTSFVMVSQVCSLSFRFPTLDLKTQQLGPPRTLFLVDLLPDRFVASHHREGRRRKRGKHQGGHATAYNSHKHGNSHRVARRELKL